MELLFTLVSANEKKSIMDILTQLAAESLGRKQIDSEPSTTRSATIKKTFKERLIKGAAKTVGLIGEDVVNSVFSMLKPTLGKIINENLQQNNIPAFISIEQIIKEYEKMKITVDINSINYEGVINRFLPDIIHALREKDPGNYLWKVYDIVSDDQPAIVKAVMNTISNEKKEEIIEMMIVQNEKIICDKISELLTAQRIEISVDDVSVIQN